MVKRKNNFLLLGLGAVGRALILIMKRKNYIKTTDINLTIIDKKDMRTLIDELGMRKMFKSVSFVQEEITIENYENALTPYLKEIYVFIDASYTVNTLDLLSLIDSHDHDIIFINSSVETWEFQNNNEDPYEDSLWKRQHELSEYPFKRNSTKLLDHGINPGLISAMTKRAIKNFHRKIFLGDGYDIESMEENELIANLADDLEIRAVVISELDGQISNKPRRVGEFVNTWCIPGLTEESSAPFEATDRKIGVVIGDKKSYYTLSFSRVPSQYIVGYSIRHSEAITIGRLLQGEKETPPATVFYCYKSCDQSIASLAASICEIPLKSGDMDYDSERIMYDDIIDGKDEIGVLILSEKFSNYWYGSTMNIHETRKLFPGYEKHINTTTLQTASGYYSGLCWIIQNPNEGLIYPEDIPENYIFDKILDLIEPIFDDFVDFDPNLKPNKNSYKTSQEFDYSFESFCI